ncbi:hypothetical protein, partial [Mycobacterium gordonae]|uniref:hypothetical protein n=1 Tax=Mycobacterium gordonae TaxID=1778 RepID=UPI001C12C2D1
MRRRPDRVELLYQQLERHILVAVSIQRPLTHLVEHITEPVRSAAHHPLFQVAMAFQNNIRPEAV